MNMSGIGQLIYGPRQTKKCPSMLKMSGRIILRMCKASSGHLLSIQAVCSIPHQTARTSRLIWAFAVRICPKTRFHMAWHIWGCNWRTVKLESSDWRTAKRQAINRFEHMKYFRLHFKYANSHVTKSVPTCSLANLIVGLDPFPPW